MDGRVRRLFAATDDPREVVSDPHALSGGAELRGDEMTTGADARISAVDFDAWIAGPASVAQ